MTGVMIMPIDWGLVRPFQGEGTMGIWEQHVLHAQVARKHPDRIVTFACFDPRRPNAVDLLQRAVDSLGAVGLKIHPAAGFFPSDRVVYPMYEKAQELGLPVMVHTGPEPKPLYSRHCQPVYVDDVAADFPDLTIILAHAGMGGLVAGGGGNRRGLPQCLPGVLGLAAHGPAATLGILFSPAVDDKHGRAKPGSVGKRLPGPSPAGIRGILGQGADRPATDGGGARYQFHRGRNIGHNGQQCGPFAGDLITADTPERRCEKRLSGSK